MPVFRSLKHRVVATGTVVGLALMASVPLVSGSASAAAGVTTFDQCQNGAVGNPPTLVACAGSAWTNGNLNRNNSHWAEGDFVPYRVALSGLSAGTHDLDITYRPGDSGAHAIDYLGSYDATESTSSTATTWNENHDDPCADIAMGSGWCVPGSPTSTVTVGAPQFAGADANNCGTAGSFTGTQKAGVISLYGPTDSHLTGFTYLQENVARGNGCDTTVDISFTLPADLGSDNIVLAWGGHIASALDWGTGNSASSVHGSPYHMSLDSVDGAVTGSMDRSMKTDALSSAPSTPDPGSPSVTPTITTVLKDAATSQPWSGTETTGATAYDTAALAGTNGPVPTGTVTYTFFGDGNCQGSGVPETVSLSDGVPADASTTTPLGAGDYSYDAVYNGDSNDTPSAVSDCEPFTVHPAPTTISNVVFSKQTGVAWSGTERAGGKAEDTATLGGNVPGFDPTGSVTYSYFANGTCGGTPVWTDVVSLTGAGAIPNSNMTDALGAGTYSFDAVYGGDTNYEASDLSACAVFAVTPITDVGPTIDPSGGNGNGNSSGNDSSTSGAPASSDTGAATPAGTPLPGPAQAAATPGDPAAQSALAFTGANIALLASIALVLLVVGSLLLAVSRRRRHGAD